MKILFINHFPLTGSGSGVYTLNLMQSLTKLGHECACVFPENRSHYEQFPNLKLYPVFFKDEEEIANQLPFNFPCFSTHPRSTFNFMDMNQSEKRSYQNAFYKKIFEAIITFNPDIIHSGHIWTLSGISSVLAEKENIPLIITCHGTDIIGINQEKEKNLNWGREWANIAYNYASSIITISKDNNKLLEEIFGKNDKVKLIKNGVDTNIFYKDDNLTKEEVLREYNIENKYDYIISFVGKLTQIKGVDTLLEALYKINNNKILTLIAGDGELRNKLEKQAKDLSLENVIFLGNLPQSKLQKIYNIVDCSIVPSRKEAFGLVACEALACGTPVITTKTGGLVDFVTEDVGILFDVDDSTALANNINSILLKEKKFDRNYISNKIKNNYSNDLVIKEVENLYIKAINKEKEKSL